MKTPSFPPRCLRVTVGLCLVPALAQAAGSIESVQNAAAEWAHLRAETVRLSTEWRSQREIVESTLDALGERADLLVERRDLLDAQTAGERQSTEELAARTAEAARKLEAVEERVKAAGEKLIAIRPWLPPRLSNALELPYRSLADPSLSVGERTQIVMSVFNRCAQFNGSVTFSEEAPGLAGEAPRVVEVVYWGLSHAYALDRAGGKAYLGYPGENGWTWVPHPEIASSVATLIAVYKDDTDPKFLELPARLTNPLEGALAREAP